jgi:uracil permease
LVKEKYFRGNEKTMQSNRIIQVEEKVPPRLLVPLSIQHMFAMFGASVLVPFIFKMNRRSCCS